MSSFFNGSLLDECILDKTNFEAAIALGSSKKEVLETFALSLSPESLGENASFSMLDNWCKENYNGLGFEHVFAMLQAATMKKYKGFMLELGIRGNPSAIALMNEIILKRENNNLVQVNFVNQLPAEDDADKLNDE